MKNEDDYKITFPGYEISYRPTKGNLIFTNTVEDPECLRMEIDMLLDQFDEVSVRRKKY